MTTTDLRAELAERACGRAVEAAGDARDLIREGRLEDSLNVIDEAVHHLARMRECVEKLRREERR